MKSTLSLLFILIAISLHAQNYACFTPANKQYFINSNGYLRGMRIDSVNIAGTGKVYFPYHTLRGNYLAHNPIFDSSGGSWLGKRIIAHADGTYVFDNMWRDSIVIKTQAVKGDTWTFFKDSAATANYYVASLSAVDTMTVLGHLDSVKYISLTAFNDSVPVDDSFNRMKIILSKHYGFAQVFDLFTFPYHTPAVNISFDDSVDYYLHEVNGGICCSYYASKEMFNAVAFSIPTYNDLYDYDIGDVYSYHGWDDAFRELDEIIDSIVDKNAVSGGLDYSVHEFKKMNKFTSSGGYPTITYAISDFDIFTNSTSIFQFYRMPEEWKVGDIYTYRPGDASHCMTTPLYGIGDDDIYIRDSVIRIDPGATCGRYYEYKLKLGPSYNAVCVSGSYFGQRLICYKQSGKKCDICPDLLSVPKEKKLLSDIEIYPNPVSDELTITFPDEQKSYSVEVIDLTGREIYKASAKANLHLHCTSFPNGFYSVKIASEDIGVVVKKFTVLH